MTHPSSQTDLQGKAAEKVVYFVIPERSEISLDLDRKEEIPRFAPANVMVSIAPWPYSLSFISPTRQTSIPATPATNVIFGLRQAYTGRLFSSGIA